jgi:hypothetical protein
MVILRCSLGLLVKVRVEVLTLVNIIVVKRPRSSQSDTEIIIQTICAPKDSLTAFNLYHISSIRCFNPALPMYSDRKDEMSGCPKKTPAMVHPGSSKQVEALTQTSLHAGKANLPCFRGQLVIRDLEITGTRIDTSGFGPLSHILSRLRKDHKQNRGPFSGTLFILHHLESSIN